MAAKPEPEKPHIAILTAEEMLTLVKAYDKDSDYMLSDTEIAQIVLDYKANKKDKTKNISQEVIAILEKFDVNNDGTLDASEVKLIKKELHLHETAIRYAGTSPDKLICSKR
jgi:Ca2+-binding EF-hand superfamily protein